MLDWYILFRRHARNIKYTVNDVRPELALSINLAGVFQLENLKLTRPGGLSIFVAISVKAQKLPYLSLTIVTELSFSFATSNHPSRAIRCNIRSLHPLFECRHVVNEIWM